MAKEKVKKTKKIVKKIKVVAKSKKKIQKIVEKGTVHIKATFNNTMVNVSDQKGDVLAWMSAGALGFKGAKKSTPFAAAQTVKNVLDKIKNSGLREIEIKVKGVGAGRESAIRAFTSAGFTVSSIRDVTPIPHGGVRPKKTRRV